jgi:hypothetical protein
MQNMMRTIDPATENIVQLHVQIVHARINWWGVKKLTAMLGIHNWTAAFPNNKIKKADI